jgi:hypothetical protein
MIKTLIAKPITLAEMNDAINQMVTQIEGVDTEQLYNEDAIEEIIDEAILTAKNMVDADEPIDKLKVIVDMATSYMVMGMFVAQNRLGK